MGCGYRLRRVEVECTLLKCVVPVLGWAVRG